VIPDGTYSESEFSALKQAGCRLPEPPLIPYVTVPEPTTGTSCEFQVEMPRYGTCAVHGAESSGLGVTPGKSASVADFVTSIPFGTSREICGREVSCECPRR
jgi:hypothetical protein